jgi:acyl-CoA hydrolase
MYTAQANPSTQQTNTQLVASQANRGIRVKWIYISSDTALTVTLEGASNATEWRQYVAANGGSLVFLDDAPGTQGTAFIVLAESVDLDYSTSAAGNVFIKVGYTRPNTG